MKHKEELKKKNDADLAKLLEEKRVALREFRFSATGSRVKNTKEGASLKKDIARILTETTARRNAEAK